MSKKRRKLSDWHANYGVNPRKQLKLYRDGQKARPLPLAPIYKEKDRASLVDSVMDVLTDWRASPFENEGSVRAGVRASLCLKGHRWDRSDLEASLVVAGGFKRMDVERPTEEEGQREYTTPVENCAWCGGDRDPAVGGRFCTVECGRAFAVDRQANEFRRDTQIYRSATRVLRRAKNDRRQCLCCGKSFMHDGDKDPRQFCSQACYFKYRKTEEFTKFPSVCRFCDKPFMGRQSGAFYCSNSCQLSESRLRTGKNVPKRISGPIFDYVITKPFNSYLSSRLTSQRFDWMLMQQGAAITMEVAA
ncbi:hypothetical protein F9K97_02170 [Brucella anthropi]|uniref:hypothetical protein n=1 Tax=Brucella anthropi TaxID=529 RepID=UPI00124E9A7F|nr:hypothetical protein [Brucella anthropi]KAB2780484.1 hypothetical protein F9L00_07850 [Brucella anthropi]KAB2789366.1 hypothetical protein F9K97_02170 [Brucella anthropi]